MFKSKTLCTAGVILAFTTALLAQNEEADEIFDLSPFTLVEGEEQGYLATSTLAGSRIRSDIRDLGSSIVVVTKDFLEDTGATDGETLLSYTGNTEVGGVQGNFTASDIGSRYADTNDSRLKPQNGQRIRGLDSAVVTRNYFRTLLPFDSYNTSRVTINRGPNSILFGLGSPGGVIDNTLIRANIGSNFGEISIRVDHRGGNRQTFDFNKTLIEDRLAIRVSGLNEHIKFKQEPAFEKDRRFFAAFDLKLFKNEDSTWLDPTLVSFNLENGEINRNPPDVLPPHDGMTGWFTGYENPLQLLGVPGVDVEDLNVEAQIGLTQEDVRNAVSAGLATVPEGMTLDEYATAYGKFVPKTQFNRFLGVRGPDWLSTPWVKAWFIYPAITFGSGAPGTQAGFNDPALAGISGMFGRWRPNGFATLDQMWSGDPYRSLPNFTTPSIQNREIFDYHNKLMQGTSNFVITDFDTHQASMQQTFWGGKAGVEVSYDKQIREQTSRLPFSSGLYKTIHLDITTHHPNGDTDLDGFGDSFVNENFGRPVVIAHDTGKNNATGISTRYRRDEQETKRATIFGTLDLDEYLDNTFGKIIGRHTLTGLFEDRTNEFYSDANRPIWDALNGKDPGSRDISNGTNYQFRRYLRVASYLGPSAAAANNVNDVRVTDTVQVPWPQLGDTHRVVLFDNNNDIDGPGVNDWVLVNHLDNVDLGRNTLDSEALAAQSHWLDGHLVSLFAWRTDSEEAFQRLQWDQTFPDPNDPSVLSRWTEEGEFNPDLNFLEGSPASTAEQSTFTWSLVGYFPEDLLFELPFGADLSAHYYEAESFQPAGVSNNILNQPLASPTGTTEEYGFTIELFDHRLSARFNWYETVNANGRSGGVGGIVGTPINWLATVMEAEDFDMPIEDTDGPMGGYNNYDDWYAEIIGLIPSDLQSVYNVRVQENVQPDGSILHTAEHDTPDGLNDTTDLVATGFELDITGQLTDNWSISLNLAEQETVISNTGPVAFPYAFEIEENLHNTGLPGLATQPFRGSPFTFAQGYANVMAGVRGILAKDGTVSQEQRKYRVNLITRYDFHEGMLKGFSLGGAIRYQDKIAAGYPLFLDDQGNQIPDIANPFFGPDETNGDLFVRYSRPIMNDKINWILQLNIRNLYRSNDDDIPVTINPDGRTALIRIPNEQLVFLTNTFRF